MQGGPDATLRLVNQSGFANGNIGQARGVALPFGFRFFGSEPFHAFNVGAKGYITFGDQPAGAHASSQKASELLVQTGSPVNLIAAWWGDHFCPAESSIKTKILGEVPNREFVIEWDGCSKLQDSVSGTDTTFQSQIWLREGSSVIRVKYGKVQIAPDQEWSSASWGLKPPSGAGSLGPDARGRFDACSAALGANVCNAAHFPANSVIQYGLSEDVDLAGRVLSSLERVFVSSVEIEVQTQLFNAGKLGADGVDVDLYLSRSPTLFPGEAGTIRIGSLSRIERLEGGELREVTRAISVPRPPSGLYRTCAFIDPANALAERDRSNNWVCSHESIRLGPDLTGTIEGPEEGQPGIERTVRVTIRNDGNSQAGPFDYSISLNPLNAGAGIGRELLLVGRVDAGLGATQSIAFDRVVRLPEILRARNYTFELEIDLHQEVEDADRSNNLVASLPMRNERPQLKVTTPLQNFELVNGCYYGEEIVATFEVCNLGKSSSQGFRPGIIMGEELVNSAFDVTAASNPSFCGVPGTWNYRACEPVGGRAATCAFEFCRVACTDDSQCGSGLRCGHDPLLSEHLGTEGAKSCMNFLDDESAPRNQRCRTFSMKGRIPVEDQMGAVYTTGTQYFHVLDDVLHSTSQEAPDVVTLPPVECRQAFMDLAAIELKPTGALVVGKTLPIERLIRNDGFINFVPGEFTRPETATFRYQYFLSTVPEISPHQIPLSIQATGGAGQETIGRMEASQRVDLVTIPSDVLPGTYYLGMILDPENQFQELDEQNNVFVHPAPFVVEAAALRILTHVLPRANLETQYNHQLVSVGGQGPPRWSAENLPPGMSLTPEGLLQGRPLFLGTFAFTARLQAGTDVTERMLALQVIEAKSELEVATRVLPIAVKGEPYGRWYDGVTASYQEGVRLVARGGQAPYRWELDPTVLDNRLPNGLEGPTRDGRIGGRATLMAEGSRFRVLVTDSLGNEARQWLDVQVAEPSTLALSSGLFPQGTTGRFYDACIEAQGGEGSYRWTVDSSSLPTGLVAEPHEAALCLRGLPTACGDFAVDVQFEDGQGQSRAESVSLTVECGLLQLVARNVRPVVRGEEVLFELGASPSDEPTFRIVRGVLPKGLSLSSDGRISGTVAADASFEPHDLILELQDALGRRGLNALTLRVEVVPEPLVFRTRSKPGCSSAGGAPGGLGILGLVFGLLLRWRRPHGGAGRVRVAWLALRAGGLRLRGGGARRMQAGELRDRPRERGGRTRRFLQSGSGGASGPPAGATGRRLLPLVGVVVMLAVGTVGCGDGGETSTASRCFDKVCEEGFSCDEADGHCKCGGELICGAGEGCSLSPSPHCVSSSCEFTSCTRGQTCHPQTGRCQCGEVVCGKGEVCVAEKCVEHDPCEEVRCGEGLVCDPSDQRCKCGGTVCGAGTVCVEGACEVDPCAGVSCGANSVCNPEDGFCHCGDLDGGICNTGEACLEEDGSFFCAISTLCDEPVCVGGSVCDPDDGQCRCGGVGHRHPVCDAEKICVEGACRGGDLCAPGGVEKVCAQGTTCDPTDGVCKCGGRFGEICGEGEGCTHLDGVSRCARLCDLLETPSSCGQGQACYFELGQPHGKAFCAPEGHGELNDVCESPNECAPGLHCSQAKKCSLVCDENADPEYCIRAGLNLQCTPFEFGSRFGYCRAF